jgi:transcription-repair coupling factor (superfamily II helicase)
MIGTFILNNNSEYYQSEIFTSILKFSQKQNKGIQLKEKNKQLLFRVENITSVYEALRVLEKLKKRLVYFKFKSIHKFSSKITAQEFFIIH